MDKDRLIDETLEKLDDCFLYSWDKTLGREILEAFAATLEAQIRADLKDREAARE